MSAKNGSKLAMPGGGDDEEAEEERELPYLFEKELIEKRNKHIHLYEHFQASRRMCPPIDRKMYASHEQRQPPFEPHLSGVETSLRPRTTRNGFPVLESQVYGWWPAQLEQKRRQSPAQRRALEVNEIVAPKQRCDMTSYGEYLQCERHTERAKFYGLRFHV